MTCIIKVFAENISVDGRDYVLICEMLNFYVPGVVGKCKVHLINTYIFDYNPFF